MCKSPITDTKDRTRDLIALLRLAVKAKGDPKRPLGYREASRRFSLYPRSPGDSIFKFGGGIGYVVHKIRQSLGVFGIFAPECEHSQFKEVISGDAWGFVQHDPKR